VSFSGHSVQKEAATMPNRREFLQMSLAASAMPALATPPFAGAGGRPRESLPIDSVVFESTLALASAFGEEARRLGLRAHSIRDDVTDLWYYELSPRWREAPTAIAGVTLSTSLFCLETLAGDYGMRICFRTTHDPRVKGDSGWSRDFAAFIAGIPTAWASGSEERAGGPLAAPNQEAAPLVSWIIAPRIRG
jgi:hypothetical protein